MFFPSRRCLETFHYMVIQLSHNGPGMPNKNESISFPSIYIMILLIFWFNLISCRKGINEVEGKTSTEHPDNVFFFFFFWVSCSQKSSFLAFTLWRYHTATLEVFSLCPVSYEKSSSQHYLIPHLMSADSCWYPISGSFPLY